MIDAPASLHESSETLGPSPQPGWLHLCNGLDPERDGGMVPSILGMTGALARQSGGVTIVTPTPCRLDGTPIPAGIELRDGWTDVEGAVGEASVVHLHGLWQGHTRRGALAARRWGIPYLVAAHGMAEPWALRHKALKKKVYTALVEGKNLRRAACLHALSRPEVGHLRVLAPRAPIALVPNGVDLGPFDDMPSRTALEAEHPELIGKFVLLFFGRLHVKKGLDLLAHALGEVGSDWPELHVVLAGRDDGALATFRSAVEALGMADRFTYLGHVGGERARRVWAQADAFILPSFSEGFSMAILEALAARLPVVVTTACHFPELAQARGGIVVESTEAGVLSGLRTLHEQSAADRREMARRGRALVEARYTWGRLGERLAEVYRWVAGGGVAPEAVEMAGGF
jgi:glycosyltransferase involved in cell wall biosynthesis